MSFDIFNDMALFKLLDPKIKILNMKWNRDDVIPFKS